MYWNNPLIELTWPCDIDPIQQSQHHGQHILLWNPNQTFERIRTPQRLADLCAWANQHLLEGVDLFCADPRCHYDIANLVKLNMWVSDIRKQGMIKPWLILDLGDGWFEAATGESRMRCLEVLPEITHTRAFVSTRQDRAHLYPGLEPVTSLDQFAALCEASPGQKFLFRLTDPTAPYGLYWYEYDSELTRAVTPGEAWCVSVFRAYANQNPGLVIDSDWFANLRPWHLYS